MQGRAAKVWICGGSRSHCPFRVSGYIPASVLKATRSGTTPWLLASPGKVEPTCATTSPPTKKHSSVELRLSHLLRKGTPRNSQHCVGQPQCLGPSPYPCKAHHHLCYDDCRSRSNLHSVYLSLSILISRCGSVYVCQARTGTRKARFIRTVAAVT